MRGARSARAHRARELVLWKAWIGPGASVMEVSTRAALMPHIVHLTYAPRQNRGTTLVERITHEEARNHMPAWVWPTGCCCSRDAAERRA